MEWTEGIVVKILKKEALNSCNDWQGLTLLSKIIIQIQAGFWKGRAYIDQIFTLRTSSSSAWNGRENCAATLWTSRRTFGILSAYLIPQEIALLIKSFFNNFTCKMGNSNHSGLQVKTREAV